MGEIRGWAFPISVDESTKRIKEVTEEDMIHQSVKMILQTNIGERFYYRDFGCSLRDFVFGGTDYTTLRQIEIEVKRSLTLWEQRINSIEVIAQVDAIEENQILLDISYKIDNIETEFHYYYSMDMG